MADNEYLRLPRGMFDRGSHWVSHELQILRIHTECGLMIGCETIKYSPVSFKSTFTRECNTANNKIYEFDDRAGRRLVLTCDSTASVLRQYLSCFDFVPKRVAFISPTFRYWTDNAHNRFFTQIGYCIINESEDIGAVDFHLTQLSQSMNSLLNQVQINTRIYLNDYRALRNILLRYIKEEELKDFLFHFQFSNELERQEILKQTIRDSRLKEQMCQMFSLKPKRFTFSGDNEFNLPEEYNELYEMAIALKLSLDKDIYFCPTDLHCIETIDSYTIRFITDSGYSIAEGGKYSDFSNRFDNRITSFWSICSGIEPIERTGTWNKDNYADKKVAVIALGASVDFMVRAMNSISNNDQIPCYTGNTVNLQKSIKKISKTYRYCTIIGKNEQYWRKIKIKDLQNNTSIEIEVK